MTPNEFEEASVVRTPLERYYHATSRREPQLAQPGVTLKTSLPMSDGKVMEMGWDSSISALPWIQQK